MSETQGTGGAETGSKKGAQKESQMKKDPIHNKRHSGFGFQNKTPPLATFRLILLKISRILAYVFPFSAILLKTNLDGAWLVGPHRRKQVLAVILRPHDRNFRKHHVADRKWGGRRLV